MEIINGFSKFSRSDKLNWLKKQANLSQHTLELLDSHLHRDEAIQEIYGISSKIPCQITTSPWDWHPIS